MTMHATVSTCSARGNRFRRRGTLIHVIRAENGPVPAFRPATVADVGALTDLEQSANEVALGHLFSGIPFPREAVAKRWRAELADVSRTVEVVDADGKL